jgi:hypothetical protein
VTFVTGDKAKLDGGRYPPDRCDIEVWFIKKTVPLFRLPGKSFL